MSRKNTTSTFVAGVLLIVALVVGLFVWRPASEEGKNLAADLSDSQFELSKLQQELMELEVLEEALPVNEEEREKILEMVPEGLNQDDLVRNLDDIAEKASVDLNSMTFSLQNVEGTTADVVSVSCNMAGDYEDLGRLLEEFENNDRLFKVLSIGVQLGDVTEDGQQMTFSITLEAYYQ
jgi:Tfp pilus assembly protein PilO